MNVASLCIRHPRATSAAVLTAAVWGMVALITMPRQEDPIIVWRLANVVTRLPGASPERIESLITDVLEKAVKEVDEVEHLYSVSRSGVSLLQVELADDVTSAAPVWQKVRHKLISAAVKLPPGTVGPELEDEVMGVFAIVAAISGEGYTYRRLKDHAEELEDKLRFLPGSVSTELFGTQSEVIEVELDQHKLAAFDISFQSVAKSIANRNTRRPSGRLRIDQSELLIEASGEFENESELADMVLLVTEDGRTLRLSDVAAVRRTTATPPEPLSRINGRRAVMVGVRARTGVRLDAYGEMAMAVIDEFREDLPTDLSVEVVHDLARYTRDSGDQLSQTLLQSIVLVLLTTTLFMGWRAAAIITTSIPLTGLIVLAIFLAVGVPLNQMSVMGMIMAIGMIVDCAIVVTEQINRRWHEGGQVDQIVAEETSQLAGPLAVSTLTTVAAFLPIYLLPGGTGEFLRAIPLSVGICLLTSLGVAVSVVPWLCKLTHRRRAISTVRADRSFWRSPLAIERHAWYRQVLVLATRWPVVVLLLLILLMAGIGSAALQLRRDFFSPVQRDQFIVDVYAPQGSALTHTAELVTPIEELLADVPEVTSVGSFIGRNAPLVFYNLWVQESYANHFAQLVVTVDSWRDSIDVARRVQRLLNERVAGAQCVVHYLEHGAPFVAPFEVRISGPSLETLDELGRRAVGVLADTPGIREIRDNYGSERLQLVAEVNEPVARGLGIDHTAVANELRYRLDGLMASHLQEGDERVGINVRLAKVARDDIADLNAVYFKPTAKSRWIPFSAVATLAPSWEASSIYRRDGQRTLTVLAYPNFGLTAAQVFERFEPRLMSLAASLPDDYHLELGGENEQRHEAERNLLNKAVYTACLFVLLLTWEFRSFRLAGLILSIVPLSLAGTMLALWVTGWPLNFMAIMGMMMLVGVMVNDAVILVDGYERRRSAGQRMSQFIVDGTLERTPHVIVTSVTTIAGFLPLALSPSPLWPPLAIAIIGGLTTSTLLCLVGVPAAYALLRREKR